MSQSPICVVTYRRDDRPDSALGKTVRILQLAGVRVQGLLQDGTEGSAYCCARLFLEDIGTGRRIQIFQNRGKATRGCRLDTSGLAEAASWVREAIESRPDVLVINRFGRQEAEGRGLLDEIGAAVAEGIPVVIAVNEALVPEWCAFAGEEGTTVPADAERLVAWCLEIVQAAYA